MPLCPPACPALPLLCSRLTAFAAGRCIPCCLPLLPLPCLPAYSSPAHPGSLYLWAHTPHRLSVSQGCRSAFLYHALYTTVPASLLLPHGPAIHARGGSTARSVLYSLLLLLQIPLPHAPETVQPVFQTGLLSLPDP